MINELLQQLVAEGKLTVAELQDLWGLAKSSVYPYLVDREPCFDKLRALIRRSRNQEVRYRVLGLLCQGAGIATITLPDALDINGDGDIDTDDVLTATSHCAATVTETTRKLVDLGKDPQRNGNYVGAIAEVEHNATQCASLLMSTISVCEHLKQHHHGRRKAKPFAC